MKNFLKFLSALFLLSSLTITSCNKYEEGPGFTVRSSKARITNNWQLSELTYNGVNSMPSGFTLSINIVNDNTYSSSSTSGSFSYTTDGTWDFNDDWSQVIFTDSNGDTDTWEIIELRIDAMKLRQVNGSITTIQRYLPK